jgi:hypothetical protein
MKTRNLIAGIVLAGCLATSANMAATPSYTVAAIVTECDMLSSIIYPPSILHKATAEPIKCQAVEGVITCSQKPVKLELDLNESARAQNRAQCLQRNIVRDA